MTTISETEVSGFSPIQIRLDQNHDVLQRPAVPTSVPSKRQLIPGYILAALVMSLGGFINGFDTGSIGGVTEMESFKHEIRELSSTMHGFTVSVILLAGAVPSLVAGQWADRFGRPQIIMLGALVFTVGAALEGSARSLEMFLTGRALCGIGQGLWLSNVSVYVTEISPSAHRGATVSITQFMCTIGITTGYFTCYSTERLNSSLSWRIPYIVQGIVSSSLAIGCLFTPMSPRWLMQHGRREEAIQALEKLDYSRTEAEKDFLRPQGGEGTVINTTGLWQGFLMIFKKGYRQRTILALLLLGMVQLCGIDGVLFYAPTLFKQAGLGTNSASFLASGVSAILITAVSIPACLFADKWPRRTAALTGGVLLTGSMFLIGILYASHLVHPWGATRWVVVVSIFVFAMTYSATWAVIGKLYASEIQPNNTRAAASCVAQGLNFFTNWLVAMITPIFLSASSSGAYFLFGGFSLATFVLLAFYMPETRGRSLESINELFAHRSNVAESTWLKVLRRRAGWRDQDAALGSNVDGVELTTSNDDRSVEPTGSASGVIRAIHSTV